MIQMGHLPHWPFCTPDKHSKIKGWVGFRDGLVSVRKKNNFCSAWNQTPNSRWSPPHPNHNTELTTIKLEVKNAGVFVINNGAQITATGQAEIKTKRGPQVYVL